jgi:hypothetical protein
MTTMGHRSHRALESRATVFERFAQFTTKQPHGAIHSGKLLVPRKALRPQ